MGRRKEWTPPPGYVPPMPYAGICPLCGRNHGGSTFGPGFGAYANHWGYYCQPHCFPDKKAPDASGAEVDSDSRLNEANQTTGAKEHNPQSSS